MTFDSRLTNDEGDVGKFSCVQQRQHVAMEVGLRDLHTNVEHPDVIEGELAIVAAKDVELALHDVGCVTTARPGSEVAGLYLLPMALLDVVYVHVVHPVCAIVPAEVVDFRVYEAACRGNSGARLSPGDLWLNPCESRGVEVKDIVQLAILVGLTPENVNFLFIGDR